MPTDREVAEHDRAWFVARGIRQAIRENAYPAADGTADIDNDAIEKMAATIRAYAAEREAAARREAAAEATEQAARVAADEATKRKRIAKELAGAPAIAEQQTVAAEAAESIQATILEQAAQSPSPSASGDRESKSAEQMAYERLASINGWPQWRDMTPTAQRVAVARVPNMVAEFADAIERSDDRKGARHDG